jgi:molybdopterin/thiamine biosynthesis adenylyltransferase
MRYGAALSHEVHQRALKHLLRHPGKEDLCFALWHPSTGQTRTTALIHQIILPQRGERIVRGSAAFRPRYFERALGLAMQEEAGLAFLHSHLGPGWQGMSETDIAAELRLAPAVRAATGLPLVGMTAGTDGAWSARFWPKVAPKRYERSWCESVRVVGEHGFLITFMSQMLPVPSFREELARTVSAWGPQAQAKLARLRIGIVGIGSVGSILAEALARMGVQHLKLIDFDLVESVNLDRHLHATRQDVGRFKSEVTARRLREIATAKEFIAEPISFGVTEESGYRSALDCDILFSCVDKPWPRAALNLIAYAHLVPVVDGGILARSKPDRALLSADWKAHIAVPGRRCLECLDQYDPSFVQMEREGFLDDARYIQSLGENHPLKRNENVFAFSLSLASLELQQMLSMVIAPLGVSNVGEFNYHFVTGRLDCQPTVVCKPSCLYGGFVAQGDHCGYAVTGRRRKAEECRGKGINIDTNTAEKRRSDLDAADTICEG